MPYATQQDMTDRYGADELVQLTDRANVPASTVDTAVVASVLGDASATIDSYLGGRYALPLSVVPQALTRICCELARYHLWGNQAEKDSAVTRNHEEALAWLVSVAKGTVKLDAAGLAPAQSGSGVVLAEGPDRQFTRSSMKGW
ncbi:gp436 family protein [Roseibium litorale]|uniref:DUF1320 domain-containing protein n=1 Tax=Roseibium litorale TaxID=2803841 RepID=A0ABR9CH15_9HYPH|nr:DUF1320 domain-containing protein [Roseibium litorale]MBD8890153.1 DUF1320 domain-containing protein [Roseibium litorale]